MINIIDVLRKHFKRLTKYAMVGTTGFILDVTLLFCFTQFVHIWYVASEILATLITFVTNYVGNTIFTYRDAMKKLNADKQREGLGMSKKVLSLKDATTKFDVNPLERRFKSNADKR